MPLGFHRIRLFLAPPRPRAATEGRLMRRKETAESKSVRLLRVGEQIRHALSDVLARGEVHDDVLATHTVSVTEVRMSPDLRHATVFVRPLLGADEGEVMQALKRHVRYLKGEVSRRVNIRY